MAKIIFKTETEVLKEVSHEDITNYDVRRELSEKFDNRKIKKYEIEFCEGVFVGDCHDISNVNAAIIKTLTLTIE